MRGNLKRNLAFLLIMLLILSIFTTFIRLNYKTQAAESLGNITLDTLLQKGILTTPSNETLAVDKVLTRSEFAMMVDKAFIMWNLPWFNLKETSFKDVSLSNPYIPYIEGLAKGKVVSGFAGNFRPDDSITLEEAAVLIGRALKPSDLATGDVISDKLISPVSSWAKDYLNYFVAKGVIQLKDGRIDPKMSLTTKDAASILVNARFPVITVLHTNDFHMYLLGSSDGKTGGSARIATIVNQERAYNPNTLLVDAGDIIGGGPPIGAFFYGKDVIEVYNAMGYDLATFGNHEFDWGKDLLKQRMSEAKYQYICANIIDTSTNSTFAPSGYAIKNFGLVRLGFVGVDTTDLPILVNPDGLKGLQILDPVNVINTTTSTALQGKTNFNIVLSHLGYDIDQVVAPKLQGINIIIGGHTHTVLKTPTVVNGVNIVQTGSYGNNLGRIYLYFEVLPGGKVKFDNMSYNLIPITNSIPENASIKAIIEPYNTEVSNKMNIVIGEALVDLNGNRPDVRIQETNLGDFIADWMKAISGTDIAITNGGGIRASIPKGPISVGSVYTVLPFDNLLVKLELTGAQVKESLENGFSQVEAVAGRFPQISGMRVKVDLSKAAGSRVIEVLVNGVPIDSNKTYTVVVNDFMAAGGDGYTVLKSAKSSKWVTGNWMRDDLVDYIKIHPQVNVTVDGRITFVKP